MTARRHRPLAILSVTALLLGGTGLLGWTADGERPPIDREEHATVKTATFALG